MRNAQLFDSLRGSGRAFAGNARTPASSDVLEPFGTVAFRTAAGLPPAVLTSESSWQMVI